MLFGDGCGGGVVKSRGTLSGKPGFQGFHRRPFMVWGQVRIPHGHGDALVSHQLLNGRKVNASHHQARGKRVTQDMRPKVPNAGPLTRLAKCRAKPEWGPGLPFEG